MSYITLYVSLRALRRDEKTPAEINSFQMAYTTSGRFKALAAGKHVLLEKPSTNTAEETKALFDYADKKGLILLEAFHSR